MEIHITITFPITLETHIVDKNNIQGPTVGDLKKLLIEKLGLLDKNIIVNVDADYKADDDTVVHNHNNVEFRIVDK